MASGLTRLVLFTEKGESLRGGRARHFRDVGRLADLFLLFFHWFLKVFWSPGDAKIALCWTYVGARLGRRLGGVLERSWEVFGRPRRPQDGHKTPQDGHKTPQDATMTVQDGSKTRPRCSQDAPKTHSRRKLRQDVPVRPRNAKTLKKPMKHKVF